MTTAADQRLRELEWLLTRVLNRANLQPQEFATLANVLRWFIDTLRGAAMANAEQRPAVVCAGCHRSTEVARSLHLDGAARCARCAIGLLDARISSLKEELAARVKPEWVIELNDDGRPRALLP